MLYENLVMQNVVASVEVTDDIPRRFITFVRELVERPDDFPFKLNERICKIATLQEPIRRRQRRVRGTDRH